MKECMTPHAFMHTLMGMGIGLIVAALVPGLPLLAGGVVAVVVAFVLEMMRK